MHSDFRVLPKGELAVYPGHPITLAYEISKAFSSFEEATSPTFFGCPRALGDSRIDGAGGCVYSALDFLRKLHEGAEFETTVRWAKERWASETSNGYVDKRLSGDEQADAVLPLFDPAWWKPRDRGAILDDTRTYRYLLWRSTGSGTGTVCFLMLNPSTADADIDDPTIKKCIKYARSWGYARVVVVNLFAFRATDPKELEKIKDREKAVGRDNDAFIDAVCSQWSRWKADKIVAAWGAHGKHLDRDHVVLFKLLQQAQPLYYLKLGTTARKSPYHPLYLKNELQPILWSP